MSRRHAPPPDHPDRRLGPVIACEYCDWCAQHVGHPRTEAEVQELSHFFHKIYVQHIALAHVEKILARAPA